MFQPLAMCKVELVIPEHDVVPVTEALAASGAFHPALDERLGEEHLFRRGESWQEQAASFVALERRILAVMEALGVDEGPLPVETPHLVEPEVAQVDIEHLEQEAQGPVRELEEEQGRLEQLRRYVSQLETIAELDVDVDTIRNLRYIFALMGVMPVANLERLQSSLEFVPSVLHVLRREDHLATVVLLGTQRDADILNKAARSAYLNPIKLPEAYRGTPVEVVAALKAGIERTRRRIAEFQAAIDHLHETHVRHLRHLLWRVRAGRVLVETISRYGRLRYTYMVAGWVPSSQVSALRQKIEETSDGVLIEVGAPQRRSEAETPVALSTPLLLKAFQGLVTNYGYPSYGEIDPTPVTALTFSLVFGMMFGDVGHGMLLAFIGALLVSRAIRALRGLAGIGTLLIACGVSATTFGFLYGSAFGFEDELVKHLWLQPLEDVPRILLASVAAGVLILTLGMVCNVVNAGLAHRWGRLLFGHNGLIGLAFYWSLIGLGVSVFVEGFPVGSTWLALAAVVFGLAVAFSELLEHLVDGHRPLVEGGFGTYLMQGLFELFEVVIGLLSNTLSFIRMGAFAVAHGALSMVVFIMAEMVSPAHGVGYWVVVVLGNLFVVGFEGMIVGIQTLRLEYYEFFGRFFSGGGVRYRPLTLMWRSEEA